MINNIVPSFEEYFEVLKKIKFLKIKNDELKFGKYTFKKRMKRSKRRRYKANKTGRIVSLTGDLQDIM